MCGIILRPLLRILVLLFEIFAKGQEQLRLQPDLVGLRIRNTENVQDKVVGISFRRRD